VRLCSFWAGKHILAGIRVKDKIVTIAHINKNLGINLPENLESLIQRNLVNDLRRVTHNVILDDFQGIPLSEVTLCAPYFHPPKIWGIGLNYPEHAEDLNSVHPKEAPASFMKPTTAIVGPGDPVRLPDESSLVTGEGEIGVVIGKECREVSMKDVPDVILGFTSIIDMTALDILKKNIRYLTRAKSFDTFFSFGPWIVTPDELPNISEAVISTLINGKVHRSNRVGNMTFSPYELVAFHSRGMTLLPGDIISCGTPGAVEIKEGDLIGCDVSGIGRLENPVVSCAE
jgi:2-keto-4-pentenoate hydratase/2-oxohepta-3-ene-1,7-dioic acid hydratase in catechol pathway